MKKRGLAFLLALCMVMTMVPTVFAADTTFAVDNVVYRNLGSNQVAVHGVVNDPITITIPATVSDGTITYDVVSMDAHGFMQDYSYAENTTLTTITFADNSKITSIGEAGFANLTALTTINWPDSNFTIGASAFANCQSLKNLTIPVNATVDVRVFAGHPYYGLPAENHASYYDANGSTITFAEGSQYRFVDGILCDTTTALLIYEAKETIILPEGITKIADHALCANGDNTTKTIHLPTTLTTIEGFAFSGQAGITSIVIPDNVTSIGGGAFANCSALESVVLPSEITELNQSVFKDCSSLTSIDIPEGVTTIGWSCFSGCTSLLKVDLPSTLTTIGLYGFENCISLESIDLPENFTTFVKEFDRNGYEEGGQFQGCESLESVVIPSGVTEIPFAAFAGCLALETVTLPEGLTTIGDYAFDLTEADENWNFKNDDPRLEKIIIPSTVTSIGEYFLGGVKNDTHIVSYVKDPSIFCGNVLDSVAAPNFVVPEELVSIYQSANITNATITGGAPTLVTGVTLDKGTADVAVGSTVTLTATVAPSDATNQDVTWASDNEEVATVENGVVTGVKAGTAIITVTTVDGGKTDTCTITVTDAETPPEKPVQKPVVFPGILGGLPFTDVAFNADFFEAVQYVYASGLMMGTAPDKFDPNATLTRAMIWTVLARMSGVDTETDANQPWWAKARTWAMDQGITDGTYPERAVTRLELVTMLWRFYNSPGAAVDVTGVGNVPDWGLEALRWAAQYGLIDVAGWSGPATRAETAVAIYKA